MEFDEIIDGYVKASERYHKERQKQEDIIERAQNKLRIIKDKAPSWINNLLKPLAKEIKKRLKMKAYEIYGPFGLDCETFVYFSNQGKVGNIEITKVDTLVLKVYPQIKNNQFDVVCRDMVTPLPRTIDEIMKLLIPVKHQK